jgi:segregation and condensation protein A
MSGIILPMTLNTARFQMSTYSVDTPVYEGPMDLLLQLIEHAELDITRLSLALVTDQYLQYIRNLPEKVADEVSAFLVIAARLIQIKSEALLPRPPVREPGEEDLGEALARQLIAYKRYRQIADLLGQRENAGLRTYLRLAPPPKVEGIVDIAGLTLDDLVVAAQEIFSISVQKTSLNHVVPMQRVTVREKIALITNVLHQDRRASFRTLLTSNPDRLEIVVTFLAVLELIKRHLVKVSQEGLFGDISIEVTEIWGMDEEIDTEFDEQDIAQSN